MQAAGGTVGAGEDLEGGAGEHDMAGTDAAGDRETWDVGVDLDEDPLVPGAGFPAMKSPLVSPLPTARAEAGVEPGRPPLDEAGLQREVQRMRAALEKLQRGERGADTDDTPAADILQQLREIAPDPEAYQARGVHGHWGVWEAYLRQTSGGKGLSHGAKEVLRLVRDGFQPTWVQPESPAQQQAPDHRKKMSIVRQMLQHAGKDPEAMLAGREPQEVQFANHKSAAENAEFVSAEIAKAAKQGAIRRWEGPGQPTVVNGLRVVVKDDKRRLCINPMYINAFMKYRPVKYEQLQDVAGYLQQGDWMITTDDKSGYWQLAIHPEVWRFVAFEWQGERWFWPSLAFGLAPACQQYTQLKMELLRPLRDAGLRLSFLIDDLFLAAESRGKAQWLARALVELLVSLGFTLSLNKCQLEPKQRVRFLGLEVDSQLLAFVVPADKVAALQRLVDTLGQKTGVTARETAQLAGKIMSLSLAVARAPQHSRLVGLALQGKVGWDAAVGDSGEVLRQARLFLAVLQRANGHHSWVREPAMVLRVVGDASESVFAAYLPGGQLGGQEMAVQFSCGDQERQTRGQFSSTEREIVTVEWALRWLAAQAPHLLQQRTVQYHTDSQPAELCIMDMKGTEPCLRAVERVYRLCAQFGTEVAMVWAPREEEEQQRADALSKYEDPAHWGLHPDVYAEVLRASCLWDAQRGKQRGPTMDVFADAELTKVPERFFARYWCPGALGVDALEQAWGPGGGVREADGELLYMFPPYHLVGPTVKKTWDERPDCVLIAPVWPRWWRVLLGRMPCRHRVQLPHRSDLLLPGSRLPNAAARGPHAPRFRLEAWIILW